MAIICRRITTFVTQQVTNPVTSWVNQQQQRCKNYPWPLNWLCWFVTVLVQIITWVVSNIVVPIISIVCTVITFLIGGVLLPFGVAIDVFCQRCNAYNWIKDQFIGCAKIEGVSETASTSNPGLFDFIFKCNCTCFENTIIEITAKTEEEAFALAKEKCKFVCK